MSTYTESAEYDTDQQERALRVILTRLPNLAAEAATTLRVEGAAARQMRLDRLVPRALRTGASDLDAQERELLADAMWAAAPAGGTATAAKTLDVRVRVNAEEKAWFQERARAEGFGSVSDFIRARVGLA